MEFEIESEIFWENTRDVFLEYKGRTFKEHEVESMNETLLGLKFKDCYFVEGSTYKLKFKVIDKEKYLWAKIKYGI